MSAPSVRPSAPSILPPRTSTDRDLDPEITSRSDDLIAAIDRLNDDVWGLDPDPECRFPLRAGEPVPVRREPRRTIERDRLQRRMDRCMTYPGAVQAHPARSTGTLVVVQKGGITGGPEGAAWFTLCEDHGIYSPHPSQKAAKHAAARPEEWCSGCRIELAETPGGIE